MNYMTMKRPVSACHNILHETIGDIPIRRLVEHTAKYRLDKDPRELPLQQFQEV